MGSVYDFTANHRWFWFMAHLTPLPHISSDARPPPPPSRLRILHPHQGQLKEMIPPRNKIYERLTPIFLPVYRIHRLPPWGCFHPRWFTKLETGAHLSGVIERMGQLACLLWQVLIENQTRVVSGLHLSLLTFCYHTSMDNLGCGHNDRNHKMTLSQYNMHSEAEL